jgi:hypothetical protein
VEYGIGKSISSLSMLLWFTDLVHDHRGDGNSGIKRSPVPHIGAVGHADVSSTTRANSSQRLDISVLCEVTMHRGDFFGSLGSRRVTLKSASKVFPREAENCSTRRCWGEPSQCDDGFGLVVPVTA